MSAYPEPLPTLMVLGGLLRLYAGLFVLIFLPAGTFRYWEGWVYWVVFCLSTTLVVLYLMKHDPALLSRRIKSGSRAETEPAQKRIMTVFTLLAVAVIVVPALDHRFGWSTRLPSAVVVISDLVFIIGYALIFRVFKENSFTASTVTVEEGQRVVTTGPYARVRHPMYSGGALLCLATPLALGSLWSLAIGVALVGAIVARLLNEERYLRANLPGYNDYFHAVRYRLIPGVW